MAADRRTTRIAIVGAGIAGLTLALALKRRGMEDFVVLEQAHELRELGAGVQIAANASRLLFRLGLQPVLDPVIVRPDRLQSKDSRTGAIIRDFPLGETVRKRYGYPHIQIHRGHLHEILAEAVGREQMRLGARAVGIAEEADGVAIRTEAGETIRAAAAVGADGIHSVVREALFGPEAPAFSGHVAFRGLVPADRLADLGLRHNTTSYWGPDRHFVIYFVAGGRLVNWVGVCPAATWQKESWSARGDRAEILAEYDGWHVVVRRIIEATDEPFKWGLFDRDPMPAWTRRRVTLLGDAAHAMLPYMSQGAAQGIEDGYVLAHCLTRPGATIEDAFGDYEAIRRGRAHWVQLGSRANGKIYHLASPWARFRRDLRFRLAAFNPRSRERRKLETLYGFDCDHAIAAHEAARAR